jgi:hypothetical protein
MPVWTAWTMSGRIGAYMRRQFLSSKRPRSTAMLSVLQMRHCASASAVHVCIARGPVRSKFAPTSNCEKRRGTDLEDIGDGDGVLGGLALGGDDGNGRPGHGVSCGRCCC